MTPLGFYKMSSDDHSPGTQSSYLDEGYREEEVHLDYFDKKNSRFPFCVVWTPIPVLTWLFPFLGHMGICMSNGVIRDFAGPYYVSEDNMAFGKPTKYWQLNLQRVTNGISGWDAAITEASEIYKKRMHILFYDNCHSHVATALNLMSYDGRRDWNMGRVALLMLIHSKYVSFGAFLKTWLPFCIIIGFCVLLIVLV